MNIQYLKTQQAAEYLGLSLPSLYRLTSGGIIPTLKPGGKIIYIKKQDLDDYITGKLDGTSNNYNPKHYGNL